MACEEAEEYKKKGNDAFKERNWDEAIKQYNKAISLDPDNAAYYSNRSGAWSSKGNHESALSDANKCIDKDSRFIKGYARKGKALFDLDKWDEAEVAYKKGLEIDQSNEGCLRGVSDVSAARQRRKASSGSSGGGLGGLGGMGNMGGMMGKVLERFKKGGRMQTYMVMMLAYYAFTSFKGNKQSSEAGAPSTHETVDYEDDVEAPVGAPGLSYRQFAEADGMWVSYLQRPGKSDSMLMLLHRTSLSAEAEYGKVIPQLTKVAPSGLRLLAPDRPCHGYSPCPEAGEPRNASWASALLAAQPAAKRLAIAAIGREAASQAFDMARRRKEVGQIWLLAPSIAAPALESIDTVAEVRDWLKEQRTPTARAAADAAHWAVMASSRRGEQDPKKSDNVAPLVVPKLHKGCKVTILYGEDNKEDEDLTKDLEDKGTKAKVRNLGPGEAILDVLAEEVQRSFGDPDASEEDAD